MRHAVLLMAYGSPTSLDEVPEYLSGIYEGKPVPEYAMTENMEKYRMVNGVSPSNAIIDSLVKKVGEMLRKHGDYSVYFGTKHWKPSLDTAVKRIKDDGMDMITAIPIFPFESRNVENSYKKPLEEAMQKENLNCKVNFINGFSKLDSYLDAWKKNIQEAHAALEGTLFLFSAHSLPLFQDESQYNMEYFSFSKKIAEQTRLKNYDIGYQSRGKYGKAWLEPSLYDVASKWENRGIKTITTIPVGFVYDHLEIKYDLDHEFGDWVLDHGMGYSRIDPPNDSLEMAKVFADLVISEQ
ncbi:ferrochelatase [Oxyplasma meridianum]|uniref:Ferrochelatase n=1 Tax=Oxyplasma meridianum TaxID=3073602 RepID=A0AAX4NEQ8_9ARCH